MKKKNIHNIMRFKYLMWILLLSHSLFAQNTGISGRVTDEAGMPIIGVSVFEKGTNKGTITNNEGNFRLNITGEATLKVSYVGYITQEISVSAGSNTQIVLKENNKSLDEVVVVGYGTVKKRDLTGSVGSVESNVIKATKITDVASALQGKVAGVNIQKNVARPGSGSQITVRGLSSINNSNSPLYVIDGIPTTDGLTDLNPDDIDKIDILKDASGTAIYGSRGANGVVIVTTKKGSKDRFSIQYDGSWGLRTPNNLPDMMNGPQYVQWRTDLFKKQGKSIDRTNADFFTSDEWAIIDSGNYTDWIGLILRNGIQNSNTITASGGDKNGTFAMSIGQLKEEGTVPGQDFNRYNIRTNVSRKFHDIWEAGSNLYFAYSLQNEGSYETLRSAYRLPPVASPYDDNGNPKFFAYRNDYATNPMFESKKDGEIRENKKYRAFGNIYLQVEPLKGLTLRSQLSPQMIYKRNGYYGGQYWKGGSGKIANTNATYNTNDYFAYVFDNQLNYSKEIGLHNINFSFVQSLQYEQWEDASMSARNFPYNSQWYNIDAAKSTDITGASTDYKQRTLSSFLGRVQYSFNDKYLLTVSGRYDGSSRLAEGNKWAFFPSAAVAWRMSDEEFIKSINSISNLKLRLSYGVTGNDAVDIYGTQSAVTPMYYDFGGTVSTSYYKNRLANYNLTWEKTTELNIGIDYGLFKGRINGTLDLYRRDARDLIMHRQLPVTSGWSSIWDNIGWVRNTGFEFGLNTVNVQSKNFTWTTNFIFDTNKNEIMELYGSKKDDIGNKWFIGQPIQVNYDYVFDGIWQTEEAEKAALYGQTPGQVKVKDLNNDNKIDANDKKVLGQKTPKWSGSISNTLKYKNWDFSVNVYTRQGEQIQSTFLSTFMSLEGNYKNLNVDYWTPDHATNKYPQPGNKGKYFDALRYCDVSFVRVGNISLGYDVSSKLLNKLKINKLHIYSTVVNPFTITSYVGFDPEWASQNTWGEATSFTTYLMGINVEL